RQDTNNYHEHSELIFMKSGYTCSNNYRSLALLGMTNKNNEGVRSSFSCEPSNQQIEELRRIDIYGDLRIGHPLVPQDGRRFRTPQRWRGAPNRHIHRLLFHL